MWQLVHDEGGLDLNSPYAYLLICSDFAATSLVACDADGLAGFVAAYRPPTQPDALFVWQVGVAMRLRRQGLARRMLHALVERPANRDIQQVTATVTPDNAASMGLFGRLAQDLQAPFARELRFGADLFPGDDHDSEVAVTVGPLPPNAAAQSAT